MKRAILAGATGLATLATMTMLFSTAYANTTTPLTKAQMVETDTKVNTSAWDGGTLPQSSSNTSMTTPLVLPGGGVQFPSVLSTGDIVFGHNGAGWIGNGYGYWVHVGTYDSSTGEFLSAEPNQGVIWQAKSYFLDSSRYSNVALEYVPSVTQSEADNAVNKVVGYKGKPYYIDSSLGDTGSWYCTKLPVYGYWKTYPYKNITTINGLANDVYFISPDEIYNASTTSEYWRASL